MSSDRFSELVELVHTARGRAEQAEKAELWHIAAGYHHATAMHMLTALRERAPELAAHFEERVTRTITRPASATGRLEALADY